MRATQSPESVAKASFQRDIAPYLAAGVRRILCSLPEWIFLKLCEIRLRAGRPLIVRIEDRDRLVTGSGGLAKLPQDAYTTTPEDLSVTFELLVSSSIYAWEDALKAFHVTLPGGHRAGFCGTVVTDGGKIKTVKNVSGCAIRVARDLPGICSRALPYLMGKSGGIESTLIVSPPGSGKTTLLRDLVRAISNGVPALGFDGLRVCVIDERSEIASCRAGVPQRDVGLRTDVLDGCLKSEGMLLALRTMSPDVVATDEMGSEPECRAAVEAVYAGVSVISAAHGSSHRDVIERPSFALFRAKRVFKRIVVLSSRLGPGTLEYIVDADVEKPIFVGPVRLTAGEENGSALLISPAGDGRKTVGSGRHHRWVLVAGQPPRPGTFPKTEHVASI